MATIRSFEDVEAWQIAKALSKDIYDLTIEGSFAKDFALRDQVNRASGSVMDNIAEGFERGGTKEFIQFLAYAKGSAGEVRSQLYRAHDHGHIDQETFLLLKERISNVSKMISNFMTYLRNSELKGIKFKEPELTYNVNPNLEPLNLEP